MDEMMRCTFAYADAYLNLHAIYKGSVERRFRRRQLDDDEQQLL